MPEPSRPGFVLDQTEAEPVVEPLLAALKSDGRQLPSAFDLLRELRAANTSPHQLPLAVAPGPFARIGAKQLRDLYAANPEGSGIKSKAEALPEAAASPPFVVFFSQPAVDDKTGHALVAVHVLYRGKRDGINETRLLGVERRGQEWIVTADFFTLFFGGVIDM